MLVKLLRLWGLPRQKAARDLKDAPHAAIAAYERLNSGDTQAAEALLAPFLDQSPGSADVFLVQGLVHKQRGELARAAAFLRKACASRAGFAAAWSQLGAVLRDADELESALEAFEKAAEFEPGSAEIRQSLGITRYQLRDVDGAIESLTRALSIKPDMSEARFGLAEAQLVAGDFERGWREYEHRPHVASAMARVRIPRWRPESRSDRVAVIAEQGLGDVLMFARWLPHFRERAGGMGVFVPSSLVDLMRESNLAEDVRSLDAVDASNDFDSYVPFMSLAAALGLEPRDIDSRAIYLSVSAERAAKWACRLGPHDGRLRVGIVWAGNATHRRDSDRSIPAAELGPLSRVEGIAFYNLQVGRSDLGVPPFPLTDFTDELRNLADTAALIAQLDLVVSVDTAVAHLAGGLGRPVWALCPLRADWRWDIAGQESPWYASARVFRASRTAEWRPVIQRVTEALHALQRERDSLSDR